MKTLETNFKVQNINPLIPKFFSEISDLLHCRFYKILGKVLLKTSVNICQI